MRSLQKGLSGEDVARWQAFLRGFNPYSSIEISGHFDDQTVLETKEFQNVFINELDGLRGVDGRVGPNTLRVAKENDFFDYDNVKQDLSEFGHNWPAPPEFSSLPYHERLQIFGQFSFKHTPIAGMSELVTITDGWQAQNIRFFEIPQLKDVHGAPRNCRVLLHRLAGHQIVKTFQDWENAGLNKKVLGWAGSFVPRFIRGSRTTLSNHAHGTAFDINVPWNGLGRTPALRGKHGSVRELVEIANNNGLFWGGHFSRPDGMHFEVAKLL